MNILTKNGKKSFLLSLLRVESEGNSICCDWVEKHLAEGVASAIYRKFQKIFDNIGFDPGYLPLLDTYYSGYTGCFEGCEESKFGCSEKDGLHFLTALALESWLE